MKEESKLINLIFNLRIATKVENIRKYTVINSIKLQTNHFDCFGSPNVKIIVEGGS